MTSDEAFKTLIENICQQCAYGAHCMDECDISGCDNRDAIKVLMSCCNEKWNRITKRPMTEEEVESYCELCDYAADEFEHVIYENLPHAGDNVLICTRYGTIHDDTLSEDHCGFYFEDYGDLEDVVAWMPLPKPYKEVDE